MSVCEHPTKNKGLPFPRFWQIIYYPNGRKEGKFTLVFEGTKEEAIEKEQAQRRAIRKAPLKVGVQFEQCIPDFMASYALESMPRTVESANGRLIHLKAHFGRLPLTAITPGNIEQYKTKRLKEGVKPITINKELNILSKMLKWAKDERLIGPFESIKLFPGKMTKSPIPVMPLAVDFERIIAEVRPEVRGIIMLEFYCGLRRSEAHKIKAEDVLLDRKLLILTGKGGKQRIVPIRSNVLLAELKTRVEEQKTGYLWVNPETGRPYRRLDESLKNAAKRAGVNVRVYHHLMRHGFGTTAIEDGVDLSAVSKVMGHSTTKTTEIYTHIAATHIIKEMDKFRPVDTASNNSGDK